MVLPAMLAFVEPATVKTAEALEAGLRPKAELPGLVGAETSRALEPQLGSPSGRRTLRAAAAGRSGFHDISERVSAILAAEDAGAT